MDAESIKLALEIVDRLTVIGFQLMAILWLIKKLELLESLIFGDWKRERENYHDKQEKELIRKEITTTGL